ncbi:hypothetical protein AB6A40_000853 [Gnathostoma spinigerum]|uniref:Uncharacterized protein n=1 Tax=Gnathostoma spinigerum TaxID=75299 RepID=A0ABD6E2V8_9BILA
MKATITVVIGLLFVISFPSAAAISCKNSKGKDVDWFVGLKLPKLSDIRVPTTGYEFLYLDKKSDNWTKPEDIRAQDSAIAQTVQQLYTRTTDQLYIFYNDGPPDEKLASSARAHAKGVVYFDDDEGFWLVHSAPNFPPVKQYEYPESAARNGQSFLCITLKSSQLRVIGTQLLYMFPSIYESNLPNSLASKHAELRKLFSPKELKSFVKKVGQKSTMSVKSANKMTFTSIVKSRTFKGDLYSELVTQFFKSSLYVQAWRRGSNNLASCNRKLAVKNVLEVGIGGTVFPTTKDHSKWAITVGQNRKAFICIGDINRQSSQFKRGGGTVCFENKVVHKLFKEAVRKTEECR